MAVEDDILKTLQKIERYLSNQSSTGNNQGGIAGGSASVGNRNAIFATKASTKAQILFTSATTDATSALGGFTSKVNSTTGLVNNLNKSLRRFNNRLRTSPQGHGGTGAGGANGSNQPNITAFNDAVDKITLRLTGASGLFKQLTTLTAKVRLLNRGMGGGTGGGGGPGGAGGPGAGPDGGFGGVGGLIKSSAITSAIVAGFRGLKDVAGVVVFEDMFQRLAARGYGTTDALKSLYSSAINAGMSLAEYNKMMDDDFISVARFKSFDSYSAALDKSKDSLGTLGIFGIEAAEMSSAMIANSSALGVSMADSDKAVKAQIKVFEDLRKSTNITAEEFRDFAKGMRDNDDAQREMVGLSGPEKIARLIELQQVSLLGKRLGLTAVGAEKLRSALEQQRKDTIKNRFQKAGIIRQVGGLMGMSSADTEEFARLAMKSALKKTDADRQRELELAGKLQAGMTAQKRSGVAGSEFIADEAAAKLSEYGMEGFLTAATSVTNATAAGAIINNGINKTLNENEKKLGKTITMFEGLAKNPIAVAVGNLIMSALTAGIFALTVGGRIGAAVSATLAPFIAAATAALGRGGIPPIPPGGGGPNPPPPGPGGARPRMSTSGKWGAALALLTVGATAYSLSGDDKPAPVEGVEAPVVASVPQPQNADPVPQEDTGRISGEKTGEMIGTVAGAAIGVGLSVFTGGLAAAILGAAIGMFGGTIGKMIGGWAGSTKATDKNTAEIKKNTEAVTVSAGANEVASNNLDSLSANVLATGRSFHAGCPQLPPQKIDTPVAVPVKKEPPQIIKEITTAPKVSFDEPKTPAVVIPKVVAQVVPQPQDVTVKQEVSQPLKEIIATPVNAIQKTVTPIEQKAAPTTNINKTAPAAEQLAKELANPTAETPIVFTQILSVLQEALQLSKLEAEQRETILRSMSSSKLSSNSQAIRNALLF